jgi:ABC-type branched-subunit amino acid transport system substrate-binding protein
MYVRRTALIAGAALLAVLAGCTSTAAKPNNSIDNAIALYGTDGVMATSFGDAVNDPGAIAGMAGTAPLTPLPTSFKNKVKKLDPSLEEFNFAGEAYDAVMITALAADLAHSTDSRTMATYVNGVTVKSAGGTECTSYIDCETVLESGRDIAYRGYAVRSGFTTTGEPSTAEYGTQHFNDSNQIDDQKTEFVTTGNPATATKGKFPDPVPASDPYHGPALKLGVLLAKTGVLAPNNKPIIAAVKLAIKDINAAGGVLGKQVTAVWGDDGTDPTKAVNSAKDLINQNVNAIIGPSFSGAAIKCIPVIAAAGVMMISPSATSAAVSAVPDQGLFFRTSPSDSLQAQAIADVIMRGGAQRVFLVARDDAYGQGLAKDLATALTSNGISAASIKTAEYSGADGANNKAAFASIATSVSDFKADSVVLLGYDETAGMVSALIANKVSFRN